MSSPNRQSTQDHTVEFFQTLADAKQVAEPAQPSKPIQPRLVGLVLGALLGLIYGVTSQVVNSLLVSGVPLSQYPFGLAGNCLINVVSGAVIGLACALPRSSVNGTFLGTLIAAVVALLQWGVANATSAATVLQVDAITPWVPLRIGLYLLLFVPFMLIFRLAVDQQVESAHKSVRSWARLRGPLLLGIIVVVVGGFSIFPTHVQRAMLDMHALIQSGLLTSNGANLPSDLAGRQGGAGFLDYATSDYILEQSEDPSLRDDLSTPDDAYILVIMARFKSNGILACAYDANGNRLRCKSYVTSEFFQQTGFNGEMILAQRIAVNRLG